jgi:hypothetical protein
MPELPIPAPQMATIFTLNSLYISSTSATDTAAAARYAIAPSR